MQSASPHTFHIPVMGLAYTIDSPIKVARFGIHSVISIIEDNLIEKMREHYYQQIGETYNPISREEPDYRARRITDYLNLVNRIVADQITRLKEEPFDPGSDICKYFEMLPNESDVKRIYQQMLTVDDPEDRLQLEHWLRDEIVSGSIDVNIMTKLDKNNSDNAGVAIDDGSDAVAAFRGYAKSDLSNSSIILSAGMNPRLFSYMEKHSEFSVQGDGTFNKKIVIKVSDYRSALIQGKMLAKKGLWVSEFRIESGLNCGGHAFATDGYLLGPILEEFKTKKAELVNTLFAIYNAALAAKGKEAIPLPHTVRVTVQGGIGTHDEDRFLREFYEVDGTGWGTPFLLVPEATTVDDSTLQLLSKADEHDVVLSHNSPLGVRFYYLKGTTGENEKFARIRKGKPGSPCTEKYLVSNTEFGETPLCTASHTYQRKKISHLKELHLPEAEYSAHVQKVLAKECLCTGLSNAALNIHSLAPFKNKSVAVNICPGPNIAYFSKVVSLQKMTDHIYGRTNIIERKDRPHMFIKELMLYVDYWSELLTDSTEELDQKRRKYVQEFHKNLMEGIGYYRQLADQVQGEFDVLMREGLSKAESRMERLLERFMNKAVV